MTKKQIENCRKKWLAQLRHPDAMKARTELERHDIPNARCCLGHACHALGLKRKVRKAELNLDGVVGKSVVFYGDSTTYLPIEARKKLNLTYNGRFLKPIKVRDVPGIYLAENYEKKEYWNLAEINDATPLGPREMADIIEENFENDNFKPCED